MLRSTTVSRSRTTTERNCRRRGHTARGPHAARTQSVRSVGSMRGVQCGCMLEIARPPRLALRHGPWPPTQQLLARTFARRKRAACMQGRLMRATTPTTRGTGVCAHAAHARVLASLREGEHEAVHEGAQLMRRRPRRHAEVEAHARRAGQHAHAVRARDAANRSARASSMARAYKASSVFI